MTKKEELLCLIDGGERYVTLTLKNDNSLISFKKHIGKFNHKESIEWVKDLFDDELYSMQNNGLYIAYASDNLGYFIMFNGDM